jgi:hypothetical protein
MAMETPARIAIVGAGPIGLEAALYARYLGYDVDVYERGRVADNILRWGHAGMFSPFGLNRSPLGLAALRAQDPNWSPPPDDALLTGREFASRYLIPLAESDLLAASIHEQTEVLSIGRDGPLKGELVDDPARGEYDFRILLRGTMSDDHAREHFAAADVVIDASGTYGNHNWLGHGGVPAAGELAAQDHVEYGLPDVLGTARDQYASRNILLVGAGHSAATNLVALAELATQAPDTWITWLAREQADETNPRPVRVIENDPFSKRARLSQVANDLAASDANHITLLSGTTVDALTWHADLGRFSVRLIGKHPGELEFDHIIANVGFRGDEPIYSELQVRQCHATGALIRLAPALAGQNALDVPQGPQALVHPEPDFYVLGAKSYGRDSRFLISDGLRQIRELFTIIGDRAELNLYGTMSALI